MELRSELKIAVSEVEGQVPLTVFVLEGRINLSNSAQLEHLAAERYAAGMRFLLLDLAGVPSITSAGLRAIHLVYRLLESPDDEVGRAPEASESSARLRIYTPSPQVRAVLRTAGFDTYIPVFADRAAAIEAFGN